MTPLLVIPAKAGTQGRRSAASPWVPAFAGMTKMELCVNRMDL